MILEQKSFVSYIISSHFWRGERSLREHDRVSFLYWDSAIFGHFCVTMARGAKISHTPEMSPDLLILSREKFF